MPQPSNQVLLEKINNLHEKVDGLKDELCGVKEAEYKNTEFRNKAIGVVGVVTVIGGFIGSLAMWLIGKVWK